MHDSKIKTARKDDTVRTKEYTKEHGNSGMISYYSKRIKGDE